MRKSYLSLISATIFINNYYKLKQIVFSDNHEKPTPPNNSNAGYPPEQFFLSAEQRMPSAEPKELDLSIYEGHPSQQVASTVGQETTELYSRLAPEYYQSMITEQPCLKSEIEPNQFHGPIGPSRLPTRNSYGDVEASYGLDHTSTTTIETLTPCINPTVLMIKEGENDFYTSVQPKASSIPVSKAYQLIDQPYPPSPSSPGQRTFTYDPNFAISQSFQQSFQEYKSPEYFQSPSPPPFSFTPSFTKNLPMQEMYQPLEPQPPSSSPPPSPPSLFTTFPPTFEEYQSQSPQLPLPPSQPPFIITTPPQIFEEYQSQPFPPSPSPPELPPISFTGKTETSMPSFFTQRSLTTGTQTFPFLTTSEMYSSTSGIVEIAFSSIPPTTTSPIFSTITREIVSPSRPFTMEEISTFISTEETKEKPFPVTTIQPSFPKFFTTLVILIMYSTTLFNPFI